MDKMIIGIDLGGTHLRIGAVTQNNELKNPLVFKTAMIANSAEPIGQICDFIETYIKDSELTHIEAISIGVPSSVANDKETVICTTNICRNDGKPLFENINIAKKIREYFNVPVYINNDVNNILLYDAVKYHLIKESIIAGIYIGTGVGASIIIDGKELDGNNGAALDLGHIPYFGGTIKCSCGKIGCCECYASGWRLQEIRKQYYSDTIIDDIFTKHKNDAIIRDFVKACAYVYAVVATIFNPAALVVGGGVMEMKDFPRELFEKYVGDLTGKDVMANGFKYIYSQKFVGKGIIGAALFARKQMNKE